MIKITIVSVLVVILASCAGLEDTPFVFGLKTDKGEYGYSAKGVTIETENVKVNSDGVAIIVDQRSGK